MTSAARHQPFGGCICVAANGGLISSCCCVARARLRYVVIRIETSQLLPGDLLLPRVVLDTIDAQDQIDRLLRDPAGWREHLCSSTITLAQRSRSDLSVVAQSAPRSSRFGSSPRKRTLRHRVNVPEGIRVGLVRCPDCQLDVSDIAPACPRCGRPMGFHRPSPSAPNATSIPGAPAAIPIEPKAIPIVFGLGVCALAVWLLASWIPSHRPMSPTEAVGFLADCAKRLDAGCAEHWTLSPTIYPWTFVIAALLCVIGLAELISGATYRAYKELHCATCNARVVGRKRFLGVQCPTGQHMAATHAGTLILVTVAGALGLSFLALPRGNVGSSPVQQPSSINPGSAPSNRAAGPRVFLAGCSAQEALIGLDKATAVCRILNTHDSSIAVRVVASFESANTSPVSTAKQVTVAANSSEDVTIEIKDVNLGRAKGTGRCRCQVE